VSISAGDITKISVGGGLTGGGDNGDVTINIDPTFALPQSCFANAIPKWTGSAWLCAADNDTTYAASGGLELLANPLRFVIQEAYRLPQACADGAVPKKQGSGWVCATAAATSAVFDLTGPDAGIPDDGAFHTFATTPTLPPGTYLIIAKGVLQSELNVSDFRSTQCSIGVDSIRLGSQVVNTVAELPFALAGSKVLSTPTTISFACAADDGADGMALTNWRMVVTKLPI